MPGKDNRADHEYRTPRPKQALDPCMPTLVSARTRQKCEVDKDQLLQLHPLIRMLYSVPYA